MNEMLKTQYGDLVATRNPFSVKSMPQAMVRWWSSSLVDHIGCCIGDNICIDARPKPGVSEHSLDDFHSSMIMILRPVITFNAQQISDGMNFLLNQKGKKYDWPGIIGFPTANPYLQDPKRWMCSELGRCWYESMNFYPVVRTPVGYTSPQTLFCSPLLKLVWHNIDDPKLCKTFGIDTIEQFLKICKHQEIISFDA